MKKMQCIKTENNKNSEEQHYSLFDLEQAFRLGMTTGYGIDHENIHEEEDKAVAEFLAHLKSREEFISWT